MLWHDIGVLGGVHLGVHRRGPVVGLLALVLLRRTELKLAPLLVVGIILVKSLVKIEPPAP